MTTAKRAASGTLIVAAAAFATAIVLFIVGAQQHAAAAKAALDNSYLNAMINGTVTMDTSVGMAGATIAGWVVLGLSLAAAAAACVMIYAGRKPVTE